MESTENPLVVVSKDVETTVQLHPLVILLITDLITRRTVRSQNGPMVGAILGAQDGRVITMEAAFECKLDDTEREDGSVQLDLSFFADRLQQYRDVHKTLDLVGWFTLAPTSGPQPDHLPIHRQLAEAYNESVLLLAFHPSAIAQDNAGGDKLPVTIYEPVVEAGVEDVDKPMQASGDAPQTSLRFKELPYKIESGDAEMIGVDFVARGGANATAIQSTPVQNGTKASSPSDASKDKGKAKAEEVVVINDLTTEEEDLIASLTAKTNAIRMLRKRITLIKKYLASLPSCYLNDSSITTCEAHDQISHPILRSIASLLARLPLLIPYTPASAPGLQDQASASSATVYEQESARQATDAALVSLLGTLGSALQDAYAMGEKSTVVEKAAAAQHGNRRDPLETGFLPSFDSGMYGGIDVR